MDAILHSYTLHKGPCCSVSSQDEAEVSLCTRKVGHECGSGAGASTHGRSPAPCSTLSSGRSCGCDDIAVGHPGHRSRTGTRCRGRRGGCGAGRRASPRRLGWRRVPASEPWLAAAGQSGGTSSGKLALRPRVSGTVPRAAGNDTVLGGTSAAKPANRSILSRYLSFIRNTHIADARSANFLLGCARSSTGAERAVASSSMVGALRVRRGGLSGLVAVAPGLGRIGVTPPRQRSEGRAASHGSSD
jgi:hypothetical protein